MQSGGMAVKPSVAWFLGLEAMPAHIDPEQIALRWESGTRTYAELRSRALALAGSFRQRGLKPGDRVACHFLNRGETFELYFACAYAGMTLVPIGFRLSTREIALILDDCQPKLVFTQSELSQIAREGAAAIADAPELIVLSDHVSGDDYERLCTQTPLDQVGFTEVQMLLYTSGTTGRPKGVQMAHSSIMWFAFQQVAFYPQLDRQSTTLLTGPMYNTAAMNEQSMPTFLAGGTVAIMPSRGWTPARMAAVIDEWKVTHAVVYPSMMEPMLKHDRSELTGLTSMKFVLTGGENCPPSTLARFRARWSHLSFGFAYGSTESGVVSIALDDEIEKHPGSVGRPFGGQIFQVRDQDGRQSATNEVGEVWTTGPSVTTGYWNSPELNEGALSQGWLKMGDLARVDADGYLYIEGRSKDMIISKGQNIYPAEVENVLLEHPMIVDASVIGLPDQESGESVCACIVLAAEGSLTAEQLIDFVRQRLASYKKPKHVLFFEELPRNPAAKVEKKLLARQAAELLEGIK